VLLAACCLLLAARALPHETVGPVRIELAQHGRSTARQLAWGRRDSSWSGRGMDARSAYVGGARLLAGDGWSRMSFGGRCECGVGRRRA
jgi:hypothetical protein